MNDRLPGQPDGEEATADTEPPRRLRLDLAREGGDWSTFERVEAMVEAVADALSKELDFGDGPFEATVALTSDEHVRRLNAQYRGLNKATNVLSFPMTRPQAAMLGEPINLGDVVVAAETVAGEARERNIEPAHHLAHLVAHGLLHLLGYDHGTEADAEVMEALEVRVLRCLGIADPYAVEPAASAAF